MKQLNQTPISHMIKGSQMRDIPEKSNQHPLNSNAVRHTKSLSERVGMKHLGIYLVRVEPGNETTEFHFHHHEEEFIYILSGRGIAEIGEAKFEVVAGDFMGFTAPSLPHCIKNEFDVDLVYLMGGENSMIDVCDYPRLRKRLIRVNQEEYSVDLYKNYET